MAKEKGVLVDEGDDLIDEFTEDDVIPRLKSHFNLQARRRIEALQEEKALRQMLESEFLS